MSIKFQDYYEILGVPRGATPQEIKKAYRKLAREHHPDLHSEKDKEKAEEKIKKINEAYAVLGDQEKRSKYDRFGANWKHGDKFDYQDFMRQSGTGDGGFRFYTSDASDTGFSDFFSAIFEGLGREQYSRDSFAGAGAQRKARRGMDMEAELEVTLEEIYQNSEKSIQLTTQDLCPSCGGSGIVGNTFCPQCAGSGQIPAVKKIKIKVPPDARPGSRVRLKGQGGSSATGTPGDLYLRIKLASHPAFTLRGDNLEAELMLFPWQAALGDKVEAPTLDGNVRLVVPPKTRRNKKLRLGERGLLKKGGGYGDIIYKAVIDLPEQISAGEKELYQKLAKLHAKG